MFKYLNTRFIFGTVFFTLVTTGSAIAQGAKGVAVQTAYVEEEIVADTTTIPAAVVAPAAMVISSLRGAVVKIEDLQVGGFIRKGTKIAVQDHENLIIQKELLELQRNDARGQLAQTVKNGEFERELVTVAEAQLALAKQKAERAKQLVAKKALSMEAAETAQASLLNASQQLILRKQSLERLDATKAATERNIARLSLQIAQITSDIAQATYQAPVNGLILSLADYKSGFARQGDVLARIQGFQGFEVEAEIPSSYLAYLRAAPQVEATDGQGNALSLNFRSALPREDRRTATRPVRFTIDGELPRSTTADGARIDIQVPIREATPSLLVPQDAIVPVAGGHVVFVFDEGKAARQIVRLGGSVGERIIITSGLEEGERVVIKGNEGLNDGAAIKEGTPPKRNVPNATDAAADEAPQQAVLETELADDAVSWLLEWSTPRGDSAAELQLSSKANLYDGEPVFVTKDGDKIAFDAEVVLPFGILTFSFDGTIKGTAMAGTVTLSGLPNGRTPSFEFKGSVR